MPRARRGRNEGSIYFDKEKKLWVSAVSLGYDAEGKRRRRKVYGRTKEEVKDKLLKIHQDVSQGLPVEPQTITVREHFTDWLRALEPNVRPTTFAAYENKVANHIIRPLGHLKLARLTYRQIDALYADLDAAGLSPRTIHDVASLLRQGLEDAVRKGLVQKNHAKLAAKRTFQEDEARFMTAEEIRHFKAGCEGERLGDLFLFMLGTGVRLGEALGLPWSAVDFGAGKVTIRQALHEAKGKLWIGDVKTKAGRRTLTLTTEALQALRRRKKQQAKEHLEAGAVWNNPWDLVFTGENGVPLRRSNIARRDMKRVRLNARRKELARLIEAGTPPAKAQEQVATLLEGVTPHTLRHTHAALLIFAGADPQVVRRRLGHANIVVTLQKYGHLFPNQDEQATERLERLMETL